MYLPSLENSDPRFFINGGSDFSGFLKVVEVLENNDFSGFSYLDIAMIRRELEIGKQDNIFPQEICELSFRLDSCDGKIKFLAAKYNLDCAEVLAVLSPSQTYHIQESINKAAKYPENSQASIIGLQSRLNLLKARSTEKSST